MKYGEWLVKRINLEKDSLHLSIIPIIGWILSIWMYSIYLPLEYLFNKKMIYKYYSQKTSNKSEDQDD